MLDIERIPGANGRAFRLVGDLETGVARQMQRILSGPASDGEGLTVDLSGLDSCDTECVRLLITLTKRARIAEGDLVLTSPSAAVLEILLKIAGPDELNIVKPYPPANAKGLAFARPLMGRWRCSICDWGSSVGNGLCRSVDECQSIGS